MNLTRRAFLGSSLAVGAAGAMPAWAMRGRSPNEALRVAVIGTRGRGMAHVGEFSRMKDVQVVALVDIDENVVGPANKTVEKASGAKPAFYKDFRKMLEDKSIDVVSVATCNHTHTYAAILSVIAGKHVYVEKPLSHTVWEGRKLVEAARKYKRIVQHGTQSRSSGGCRKTAAYLAAGKLGKINISRGLCYKRRKSIGKAPNGTPPEGVDYDLWLGPAAYKPFNPNKFHYNWHWQWDTGNGDIGNQGVHEFDKARWYLGRGLPNKIVSIGGRLGYEDDGETPNTQIAILDYGDALMIFEVRGLETDKYMGQAIGNIVHAENGHVAGTSAFDKDGKPLKMDVEDDGRAGNHFQNFIDGCRAGDAAKLNADVLEGHLSSALGHLANISYRLGTPQPLSKDDPFTYPEGNEAFHRMREHLKANGVGGETPIQVGRVLTFDPETETFKGDAEADALLRRKDREPYVIPENP